MYNAAKIPIKLYNGKKLPFKDGVFDKTLFVYMLHHTENIVNLLEEAKRVVRLHFDDFFNEISRLDESFDFKTRLQEICQRRKKLLPVYKVVKEEGPDHQKSFHVEVSFDGETLAFGMGKSKKDAEQMAASQAIRVFDEL